MKPKTLTIALTIIVIALYIAQVGIARAQDTPNDLTSVTIAIPPWLIPFVFAFLGELARTFVPYYKKLKELEATAVAQGKSVSTVDLKWNHFYTYTLVANILICLVGTMFFFSMWTPPAGTMFAVAIASFIAGFGAGDITNTILK